MVTVTCFCSIWESSLVLHTPPSSWPCRFALEKGIDDTFHTEFPVSEDKENHRWCMCTPVCVCMCMPVCVHVCAYMCVPVCVNACVSCVCVPVCVPLYVCACVYVCASVCACVCECTCVLCVRASVCVHLYGSACVCVCTCLKQWFPRKPQEDDEGALPPHVGTDTSEISLAW